MVSTTKCPFCGVETGDCFGDTGKEHERDCPKYAHRC